MKNNEEELNQEEINLKNFLNLQDQYWELLQLTPSFINEKILKDSIEKLKINFDHFSESILHEARRIGALQQLLLLKKNNYTMKGDDIQKSQVNGLIHAIKLTADYPDDFPEENMSVQTVKTYLAGLYSNTKYWKGELTQGNLNYLKANLKIPSIKNPESRGKEFSREELAIIIATKFFTNLGDIQIKEMVMEVGGAVIVNHVKEVIENSTKMLKEYIVDPILKSLDGIIDEPEKEYKYQLNLQLIYFETLITLIKNELWPSKL